MLYVSYWRFNNRISEPYPTLEAATLRAKLLREMSDKRPLDSYVPITIKTKEEHKTYIHEKKFS